MGGKEADKLVDEVEKTSAAKTGKIGHEGKILTKKNFATDKSWTPFYFFYFSGIIRYEMEEEKKQYLEKIEKLIYSADKFNEMSFRMVLEGLVAKGGEEAEYLLIRFINLREVDTDTRINIIRVVGYIRSPHFLVPLKKSSIRKRTSI